MKTRKMTVEKIIDIYGKRTKKTKIYLNKKQVQPEKYLKVEPEAFSLADQEDTLIIYIDTKGWHAK